VSKRKSIKDHGLFFNGDNCHQPNATCRSCPENPLLLAAGIYARRPGSGRSMYSGNSSFFLLRLLSAMPLVVLRLAIVERWASGVCRLIMRAWREAGWSAGNRHSSKTHV